MTKQQGFSDASLSANIGLHRYDVAISYAKEDRAHAEALALRLRGGGCKVFLDTLEPLELWGADVGRRLEDVFDRDARLVVILASRHWASRRWTMHERNAIRRRALRDDRSVLPITMGVRHVPGLPDTLGHLDFARGIEEIAELILRAVEGSPEAAPPSASTPTVMAAHRDDDMQRSPYPHHIPQTTIQPSQHATIRGDRNVQKTNTKITTGVGSFGLISILGLVIATVGGMAWLAFDFVRSQPRDAEGGVEVLGIQMPAFIVGDPPDVTKDDPEEDVPVERTKDQRGEQPTAPGHLTKERLEGAWRCPRTWIDGFPTSSAIIMFTDSGRVSITSGYYSHDFEPPFSLWNDAPYTITSSQSLKVEDREVIVNMDESHSTMHVTGGAYTFQCTRVSLDTKPD